MTVRDLLALLSPLNPDSTVLLYQDGPRPGYRDPYRLAGVRVAPRGTSGYYPRFQQLPHRNTVEAVVLE